MKVALRFFMALAVLGVLLSPAPVLATHGGGHLALLEGAWDHTNITVKINANGSFPPPVLAAVSAAIADWNSAIDGSTDPSGDSMAAFDLTLVENGKADIVISLRKGTNPATGVVGQAITSIKNGRILHSRIQISGAGLGSAFSATLVGNIARHELGHALGLGHADFAGELMSSTLPAEAIAISACDKTGFGAAHQWYPGIFSPATATSVDC